MNFRTIIFILLVSLCITFFMLLLQYLVSPRASLIGEILKKFRYDEEQNVKVIKKQIWR